MIVLKVYIYYVGTYSLGEKYKIIKQFKNKNVI